MPIHVARFQDYNLESAVRLFGYRPVADAIKQDVTSFEYKLPGWFTNEYCLEYIAPFEPLLVC